MELHSQQYSITITKQDSATQHNILKEQYDYIYDPDNYLSADEYCFFDILIKSTAQTRRLALVSFPYGAYDEHPAALETRFVKGILFSKIQFQNHYMNESVLFRV